MKRVWTLGEFYYNIEIAQSGKIKKEWADNNNKILTKVPTHIKKEFATELENIADIIKQIEKTIKTQKSRIDKLFRVNRFMSYEHFEKYYINHPLMFFFGSSLIWNFHYDDNVISVMYFNGVWKNEKNETIITNNLREVSLWHPINSSIESIKNWRRILEESKIMQPIKQAFREIYIVTDAELKTKTYSNRMSAHILKQYQVNKLLKLRDWHYSLIGCFYESPDEKTAKLNIKDKNIRAELTIKKIDSDSTIGNNLIYDYVLTDSLSFYDTIDEKIIELENVDKVLFSEIMRDVDLFVGVASIGNDPNFQYNNEEEREYWNNYSFGSLSEIAKTRKNVLESIIPKLKISDVCKIDGKFLIVKGTIRTYKIHIGSGNILMEPNDEYLCIVEDNTKRDPTQKLFIPFECDKGVSLILSKAFLLANDNMIEDSTILSQIRID